MNKALRVIDFFSRPSLRRTYFDDGSPEESVKHALVDLQHTTARLRFTRVFAAVFTSLNILGVLLILGAGADSVMLFNNFMGYAGFAALITLLNLGVVILFENMRKKGDRLFEEISDALHWYVGYRKQNDNGTAINKSRPPDARAVLQAFARAADLPLIPGKFGPAVYAGVNVVVALLLLYFRLKS